MQKKTGFIRLSLPTAIFCLLVFLPGFILNAQSIYTEHTLKLDNPSMRPAATIDKIDWLAGSWKAEAFGGEVEEIWTKPSGGAMAGLFKVLNNKKPFLYEFELIVEEQGSLTIQLKHFSADLSSWEEKDEYISFPLVKLTKDAAFFDGLSYLRDGPDRLKVYVAIKGKTEVHEEEILFRKDRE